MLTLALLLISHSVMAADDVRPSDALWDALRNDDLNGVLTQIHSGISANSATYLETPLAYAIRLDSIEMVNLLLENGANPNMAQPISSFTPLMVAAKHKKPEVLELLLSHGANVNITTVFGRTPLNVAALYDSVEVGYILLTQTNVDVNAHGKFCALALASRQGYLDFVTLMLKEAKVVPSEGCLASAKAMARANLGPSTQHQIILDLLNAFSPVKNSRASVN